MNRIYKLTIFLFIVINIFNSSFGEENFFNKGKKLSNDEKYEDARFMFERSIVFNPKDSNSYLYLAKIYNIEENQKKEEKNLEATLLIEPDNEEAILMTMKIALKKSNYSKVKRLSNIFTKVCNKLCEENKNILILGRKIKTIKLSKGSVWMSFQEICEGPRSAKDYIEVCSEFHTVFVSGVPIMKENNSDAARRFIALVDECYERNVNLILSLEANLNEIYVGNRLAEPFKRTLSRLEEMRSREYLSRPHLI